MKQHQLIATVLITGLLMILAGCKNNQDILKKERVVIAGEIQNTRLKTVSITFLDIIRDHVNYTQVLDSSNGQFSFVFDIYHSQDVRFSYGNKKIRLFVEPSDSLFISFDASDLEQGKDFRQVISFSGRNKSVNEIMQKYSFYKKTPEFIPECEDKTVRQYLTELEQQVKIEKDELEMFVREYNPQEKFIRWAKNDIIYSNANYLIDYKAYLSYNNLASTDSLFKTELFPVSDEKSLASSMFGLHLWHYALDRYLQNDTKIMEYMRQKNYLDAYSKSIENVIEHETKGIIRDVMAYKMMSALFEKSFTDFEKLWNKKSTLIGNQLLNAELEHKLSQAKSANNYPIAYLENHSKKEEAFTGDILKVLFKKSKDKVLYVDIWAAWCGPCRAEMPRMIELYEKLKNGNIEFISVCCNSDRHTWKLLVCENKLPGKHFYLDKNQTEIFRSKLKFPGFPTYLILKDGEIKNKNAPRPGSGKAEKLLSELSN